MHRMDAYVDEKGFYDMSICGKLNHNGFFWLNKNVCDKNMCDFVDVTRMFGHPVSRISLVKLNTFEYTLRLIWCVFITHLWTGSLCKCYIV